MCRKSGLLFLCFVFPIVCHAQLQGGPLVNNVGELLALVDVNFTNQSTLIISPPGIPFEQDLNIVKFDDSFEASFIDTLVSELKGTAVTYPVRVIESNTVPRTRIYLNDAGEVAHTAQIQVVDYPNIMIEAFFGLPPAWLSTEEMNKWYEDRDTLRETVSFDLMHTSQVPAYANWIMSMSGSSSGGGSNTNHVGIAEIGFVDLKRTEIGDVNLSIHAPVEVGKLDVFETAMLPTLSWKHSARLNRNIDPIVWRYEGTMPKYFTAGNGSLDSDGDNIPDAFEKLVLRTNPDLADSDGDGLDDWWEVYIYGINANNVDSDGDGLLDGWEVQYQLDPYDSTGINGANGDPDGDGLTNKQEQTLDGNPQQTNPLVCHSYSLREKINYKTLYYTCPTNSAAYHSLPAEFWRVDYSKGYLYGCEDDDPGRWLPEEPWPRASDATLHWDGQDRITKYRFRLENLEPGALYHASWTEIKVSQSDPYRIDKKYTLNFIGKEGVKYIGVPDEGDTISASAYLPVLWKTEPSNFVMEYPDYPEGFTPKNLCPTLTWEEIDSPIDANTNWLGGYRIFPGKTTPEDNTPRNKVRLRITTWVHYYEGMNLYLKAFDVDDPTPEDIDPNGDIDSTGEAGNDNYGTPQVGTLSQTVVTLDEHGNAEVEFEITMQPGDNFRIVATLDPDELAKLTVDHPGEPLNVEPGNAGICGFDGWVSPMLTVWRKLWIEFDSMEAGPPDFGDEKNFIEGTVSAIFSNTPPFNRTEVSFDDPLPDNLNRFQKGRITINYDEFVVESSGLSKVELLEGEVSTNDIGAPFILYDDDDRYLNEANLPDALPRDSYTPDIVSTIAEKYTPAYIQVMDANAKGLNSNQQIPFKLNEPSVYPGYISHFDNAKDLDDEEAFWAHTVVFGYQPETANDADPASESQIFGQTIKNGITLRSLGYSVIFMESFCDHSIQGYYDPSILSHFLPHARDQYIKLYYGTIAHEIAHSPGRQGEAGDHGEGGLMTGGSTLNIVWDFTGKTIKRFRETKGWAE